MQYRSLQLLEERRSQIMSSSSTTTSNEECPSMSVVKPDKKCLLDEYATQELYDRVKDHITTVPESDIREISEDVFVVEGIITPSGCHHLRDFIDRCSLLSFWHSAGRQENEKVMEFRDADTIEFRSPLIAKNLFLGAQSLMDRLHMTFDEDSEFRDLVGEWFPVSINENMLLARYPDHGSFAPHTDGNVVVDFNTRSFYSIVLYLSTVPAEFGGNTFFFTDDAAKHMVKVKEFDRSYWSADDSFVICKADCSEGRMVVFRQDLVHESRRTCDQHIKYIIRTDVLFERKTKLCTKPNDIEAYRLYREAEDLAEDGDVENSVRLFKKAFKLSRELATFLGQ